MATVPQARSIPALPKLPLIGNLIEFRRDPITLYGRMQRECGDIAVYHLGKRRVVMLFSPRLIGEVLVDRDYDLFEKSPALRRYLAPLLGRGLLTTDRASHRQQRKLIAPAFQHRRIASYADTMVAYAEQVQQEWKDGQRINIAEEMLRITLGVVGKTLFDADILGEAQELREALSTGLYYTNAKISAFFPLPDHWPTPQNRRFQHAVARLDATVYRMIDERRRLGEDRGDLLSMLLQAQDETNGQGLTDQEVRDEAMTLFLAGYETTSTALSWAVYLLAQHPDIYAQMRAEVDRVLVGRSPTFEDLPQLPYTLQVFKEALRLYPPAHAVGRQVAVPVEIEGYQLPVGTIVGVSMYWLHRRPEVFPDPEQFNPDRWTPENEASLPKYAYLPFSIGLRNCIGSHFAMLEGQLILATLAQRVTFDLLPGQRISMQALINLRPKHGVMNGLVHRRSR